MPTISVIVPVYKVEPYIHRCIDSILAQTFTDFELILVDDGSPDNCGKICDEYAAKDSRIRVIHQENGGVSSARNAGIECAAGEYVTFCDSDDYYKPECLAVYLSAISDELDMVSMGFTVIDEQMQGRQAVKRETGIWDISGTKSKIDYLISTVLYNGRGWEVYCELFRTDIIKQNNIRFCTTCENFAEDLCFTLEYILCCNKVCAIESCEYCYVMHAGSMTDRSRGKVKLNALNEVGVQFGERYLHMFPTKGKEYAVLYYLIMQNQYCKVDYDNKTCLKIKERGLCINNLGWHNEWMRRAAREYKQLSAIYGKENTRLRIVIIRFLIKRNILLFKVERRMVFMLNRRKGKCHK